MLQDGIEIDRYAERTRVLLNEGEMDESVREWKKMSEVMVRAAKYVCGLRKTGVSNPWIIRHENHIKDPMTRVDDAVDERNECVNRFIARNGMRKHTYFVVGVHYSKCVKKKQNDAACNLSFKYMIFFSKRRSQICAKLFHNKLFIYCNPFFNIEK